jgi:hypothetical protein
MNEEQLFLHMFKPAQTTIADLAGTKVSPDNLKL